MHNGAGGMERGTVSWRGLEEGVEAGWGVGGEDIESSGSVHNFYVASRQGEMEGWDEGGI